MAELLYREEVYAIVGAAMEVYNQLGHGFLEAVYQEALALEMSARQIPFQEQQPLQILYKQHPLRQSYITDFVAFDKIIIETQGDQAAWPE